MKAVLDTNVIISGLLWKKTIKALFDLADSHKITICLTPKIIDEVFKVLSYPRIHKQLDFVGLTTIEIINYLLQISELYPDLDLEISLQDTSDKIFLGAAVASNAKYIITGDYHLLSLKKFRGIKIINPRQFLEEISK